MKTLGRATEREDRRSRTERRRRRKGRKRKTETERVRDERQKGIRECDRRERKARQRSVKRDRIEGKERDGEKPKDWSPHSSTVPSPHIPDHPLPTPGVLFPWDTLTWLPAPSSRDPQGWLSTAPLFTPTSEQCGALYSGLFWGYWGSWRKGDTPTKTPTSPFRSLGRSGTD